MDPKRPIPESNPKEPDAPPAPSPGQRERPADARLAPDAGSSADSAPGQWSERRPADGSDRARADDPVGETARERDGA